ncbi:MAG: lysophospholipid acyltransferase family protein [Janthinobacterium lividum]
MPLERQVPPISPLVLRFFRRIVRRYFRRHFRAVQVQHAERLTVQRGPLVVFGNHSSWWDPMLLVLLGQLLMPDRRHYAPIDARALEQYPILRKLGIFPVEMGSPRGAAQFLRTAEAVLRDGGVLWLTPQGRFVDPREFPLAFKPGLAALAQRVPEATFVPMAVEYTFWDERLPEALVHVGEPVSVTHGSTSAQLTRELETALASTMYALQQAAMARDARAFTTVFSGARGTGGMYGLIRRWGALVRGRRPLLDHTRRDAQEDEL